jgi:heme A synthase
VSRFWRYLLWITAILGALQGLLGLTLVALGQKPGTGTGLYYLHYVYGGIVALAIPVALTYTTSGKNPRRDMLIFSIAAIILAAAGVRAWMTGPAGA